MPDKKQTPVNEGWRQIIAGRPEPKTGPVTGGSIYLVKENGIDRSIGMFKDMIGRGAKGLIIARIHPDKLRQSYNLQEAEIIWLTTNVDYHKRLDPNDMSLASHTINQFINGNKDSVILLDGLEYLATQNSYEMALKFVQSLNDSIAQHNSPVMIPVDPNAFDKRQLSLLESECKVVEQPAESAIKEAKPASARQKTPQDLLGLLLKTGRLRASNASKMLGIERGTLERWIMLLVKKGMVVSEGNPVDPFLEVTPAFMRRLKAVKQESAQKVSREFVKEVEKRESDVAELEGQIKTEREKRTLIEQRLKSREDELKSMEDELKSREDDIGRMQTAGAPKEPEGKVTTLRAELEQARNERSAVEAQLKDATENLKDLKDGLVTATVAKKEIIELREKLKNEKGKTEEFMRSVQEKKDDLKQEEAELRESEEKLSGKQKVMDSLRKSVESDANGIQKDIENERQRRKDLEGRLKVKRDELDAREGALITGRKNLDGEKEEVGLFFSDEIEIKLKEEELNKIEQMLREKESEVKPAPSDKKLAAQEAEIEKKFEGLRERETKLKRNKPELSKRAANTKKEAPDVEPPDEDEIAKLKKRKSELNGLEERISEEEGLERAREEEILKKGMLVGIGD